MYKFIIDKLLIIGYDDARIRAYLEAERAG